MNSREKRKPRGAVMATPCLSAVAASFLKYLCTDVRVFEFGSGGSTLWLASIAAHLTSIEDDLDWYKVVATGLSAQGTPIELRFVPTADMAAAIDRERSLDVVFVDCLINAERKRCILSSLDHIRPGGWLVADDFDFPIVAKTIATLTEPAWSTGIMHGHKIHPLSGKRVSTATAFCRKGK